MVQLTSERLVISKITDREPQTAEECENSPKINGCTAYEEQQLIDK